MARGSQTLLIFITTMMLTSLFAGINWDVKNLTEMDEKDTEARQWNCDIEMIGALQPLEGYVDQYGNTQ